MNIEEKVHNELNKLGVNWYMDLHNKGVNFIKASEDNYYSELNEITIENIETIRLKSNTMNNTVWSVILNNFEIIKEKINSLEKTLNYNDFYWKNLVVSKDKSEAFMFDYNFLGTGFRYCDIRNVCSSLSKEASEIFLKQYGDISPKEKIIDDFTSEISTLILAYKKEIFPSWAKDNLDSITNGKLEGAVRRILEF